MLLAKLLVALAVYPTAVRPECLPQCQALLQVAEPVGGSLCMTPKYHLHSPRVGVLLYTTHLKFLQCTAHLPFWKNLCQGGLW